MGLILAWLLLCTFWGLEPDEGLYLRNGALPVVGLLHCPILASMTLCFSLVLSVAKSAEWFMSVILLDLEV